MLVAVVEHPKETWTVGALGKVLVAAVTTILEETVVLVSFVEEAAGSNLYQR